ncbi:MAG: hypothetical protein OEW37_08420 [Rhodospirillaceae bacterium]|nr:hypothetical protein [Rhodospirillaceae bacterium]
MYKSVEFPKLPNAKVAHDFLSRMTGSGAIGSSRKVDRPLAIYGAGNLGRMAREYLDRLGIKLEFVVDANAEKYREDDYWSGIAIVSPDDVLPEMQQSVMLAVCVVTSPYVSLATALKDAGWEDVVPFYDVAEAYRDVHPLSNGWFAKPFSQVNLENISTVLQNWEDDLSRAHHLQFIAWRRLREEWIFNDATVTNDNRFFIPEVTTMLGKNESFADVGAHTGNVTTRFIDETKGQFKKIWDIEPDPDNLLLLTSAISALPSEIADRVEIIPATMGSKPGEEKFFRGIGYASQRSKLGQHMHQIETIDSLGIAPSFIKLHLEGGELDALKGACDTILKSRPIIAATSYHNDQGIWELPMWLMDNLTNYRFYMRVHSWCGTGAVVYALPN